jgi:hypothetical protein
MVLFSPFVAPIFLIPLTILSVIVGVIVMGFAVVGGPSACDPGGGPIVLSEANADSFQQKWDAFDASLDAGTPATVTFTESEISSRAVRAAEGDIDDQDWIQDFRVCIYDGEGAISGTVNLPGFLDIKFRAKGTAYITDQLRVKPEKVEVGSIPGFFGEWVDASPDDDVDLFEKDDFEHDYTLTLREGEAEIVGTP